MNVPKLRFKEFSNDWKDEKLEDVVDFLDDRRKPIKDSDRNNIKGIYPYYGASGIIDYINDYIFDEELLLLGEDGANILSRSTQLVFKATGKYWVNNHVHVLRPKENYNIDFLESCLENINYEPYNTGTAQPKLNQEVCRKINIKTPSLKEQVKIGKTLSLLDKKIELQTKKIEILKLFKKGLINHLFSQNTIMKITVKDLGTIITGTTPSKENNFFWHNGNIPWITPSDITYERDISNSMIKLTEEGLLNGRYLPKNSILVTCIASIGKNTVLKVNGSCNQQINAIIPNEKFNYNYIYYLMEYMTNYMKSIAGTSATSIINKNDFEKLNVNVHSITEQIKIDKILSSIETKEKLENEYLHNITKLKTYLLQNMFI